MRRIPFKANPVKPDRLDDIEYINKISEQISDDIEGLYKRLRKHMSKRNALANIRDFLHKRGL